MKIDKSNNIPKADFTPVCTIQPLHWMTSEESKAVFDALETGGGEVRFVGGCVRDVFTKLEIRDIDIATTITPKRTMELLQSANIKAIPTGIEHGTITAVIGKYSYEITTLRADRETDGRHAKVDFTNSWIEDAQRRDFTFNALSATQGGDVYDPFNGISDLFHGRVNFIGQPTKRIEEDYLRILRFFRFQATHGISPPSQDALSACRNHAKQLHKISGDRIRDEMLKILTEPNHARIIMLMCDEKILEHILPEITELERLNNLARILTIFKNTLSIRTDPLRNLASMIPIDRGEEYAKAIARRWNLSNQNTSRLIAMVAPLCVEPDTSNIEIQQAIYKHGAREIRDRALISWASHLTQHSDLKEKSNDGWIKIIKMSAKWEIPKFPINGEDVIEMGVIPGPRVGKILKIVEDWWVKHGLLNDRDTCLEYLSKTLENRKNNSQIRH